MFGFCFSRLGSREEAEDAVQSTFLNAHRALQRGVTPDAELAWLLKIAHNVCLTRRRSTRRRGRVEAAQDIDSMQDYLPAPAQDSSDELIRLDDALAQMPESQRRAIVLREWQGLSYAEIARELKVTQSAVETLIFRARRSLASNLETVFERPRVVARVRHAVELGWLLNGLRALLEGGAAVKAATAAVAISSATILATSAADTPQRSAAVVPARAAITQPAPAIAERPRLPERELSATRTATKPQERAKSASPAQASERSKANSAKAAKTKEKVKRGARDVTRSTHSHHVKQTHQVHHPKRTKPLHTAPRVAPKPRKTTKKQAAPAVASPAPQPEASTPPDKAKPARSGKK